MSKIFATLKKYERHISAVSLIAGFAFDNYFFGRVDHPRTQLVLFAYICLAIGSIVFMHFIESHADSEDLKKIRPGTIGASVFTHFDESDADSVGLKKIRPLVIGATQFALGALMSAFLVFYGRSAVFTVSWPFLIVLGVIFIGNEVFKRYHDRLVFTCTLLFFVLFSYTIFVVPIVTGVMGKRMFLLSGAIAIAAFALVVVALSVVGPRRMKQSWKGIAAGAAAVLVILNVSYFTNILPPLPLALTNAGVFHSVTRDGAVYRAVGESRNWIAVPWLEPTLHINRGESLSVYSAVFAPIQLQTKILHVWQLYDDAAKAWKTQAVVSYRITGGRDGGYRGYSTKSAPAKGHWRVNIQTADGRLIGRVAFSVVPVSSTVTRVAQVLN